MQKTKSVNDYQVIIKIKVNIKLTLARLTYKPIDVLLDRLKTMAYKFAEQRWQTTKVINYGFN